MGKDISCKQQLQENWSGYIMLDKTDYEIKNVARDKEGFLQ